MVEALKDGGYQTAFIGKWHLGEGAEYFPELQGFDLNLGGSGKGHPPSFFSPYGIAALRDGPKGEYLTDRLTNEALKFMETATANKKPFFLYLSHFAVHTPMQAKQEVIAKYRAKAAKLEKSGPEFIEDRGSKVRQIQNHAIYGAMVESLDDSVGRVMDKLTQLGIESNTLVVFTSDNGGLSPAEGSPTSNVPLRTGKGWAYEGGIRGPLIVKWTGGIKPSQTRDEPVISTDYFPTLLEFAGLPLRSAQHLDGISVKPALTGGAMTERPLFWHYPHYSNQNGKPHGAVRLGNFKLIEWYEEMQVELYNLADDIGEHHDLSQEQPEKTAELTRLLHDWRSKVRAQMPTANPNYQPKKALPNH